MKASETKRGHVVEHEGKIYQVRAVERSAPTARGGNVTFRFTLYSVPGGNKFDLSLRADDDLKEVDLARRQAGFSYMDGEDYVFLDSEDFTPYTLSPEVIGDFAGYITEAIEGCFVQVIDEQPIGVQLPQSVVLEVVETAPELKGASATKRTKPARLATGIEVQVPEYIVTGEKVRVSTETGEFMGRA
ncbi:MAG TPA: elongation factor P-like protein YeiP [Xanthomonadaceae bacterium]|nr:elongation factor P-like protein YeiP [Xanthomonadaceae bacterium]